jgi:hypothetical protein
MVPTIPDWLRSGWAPKLLASVQRSSRPKLICFGLAAAIILLGEMRSMVSFLPIYQDDAYYYFIVARNIALHGQSSFDGQVLTNGYHPLWLCVLIAEYAVFGTFGPIPHLSELACVLGALALLIAALPTRSWLGNLFLTVTALVAVRDNTLNGMEASLTVLCLAALIFAIERLDPAQRRTTLVTALLGTACIGARIDSAVFVIPLLFLAWSSLREKALGFAVVGGAGALYAAVNLAVFQTALPISGTVKALGGLQLNTRLLDQISAPWTGRSLYETLRDLFEDLSPVTGWYHLFAFAALALPLYAAPAMPPKARLFLAAFGIGFALYCMRLFFFSSWVTWPWYYFPAVLGAYACVRAGLVLRARQRPPARPLATHAVLALTVLLALGLVLPMRQIFLPHEPIFGYIEMGKRAADEYGALLNGGRVAMGDRAGGFAINYRGPVTQLEGLVGDVDYLRVLEGQRDLKSLLCARHVKYVLSYEVDLGDYATHPVPLLRPFLTSYKAPALLVAKADEAGRLSDPRFFAAAYPMNDRYLYIWSLSGCPESVAQ